VQANAATRPAYRSHPVARLKLIRAAEAAMGALGSTDVLGWESRESTADWVHDLRRADDERVQGLRWPPEEARSS